MEHYYQALFNYVEQIIKMPESDKEQCRTSFTAVKVSKDTIIARAGEVPQFHNFIVSGYMRNFYFDEKVDEVTVDLNDGPRFFTSYFHFMHQTVSNENLHCITDCELLRITKPEADRTAITSFSQKDFTIKLFEQIQEEDKQRLNDLANLSGEQRYIKLLKNKPSIVKNVPLKFIASYIGVKPESLSRIRRELS